MNNRSYNIFFHTHTVSGIVISVVLYVIFFAGSFSFFRDDFAVWETNGKAETGEKIVLDYNKALQKIDSAYVLQGRNIRISRPHAEQFVNVNLEPTKDSLAGKKAREGAFFYLDTKTFRTADYAQTYTLGEFLYRLHFLAQIPYPVGYYLSGFTALFFLFAIITGVLVHWKKIVSNFFVFRPKEKWKTLWTDAHTALGMIGLPFQFVYAVTGTFFMISAVIVAPFVTALYNGDQKALFRDLGYFDKEYAYEGKKAAALPDLEKLVLQTGQRWKNIEITGVDIQNYGDAGMHVIVSGQLPKAEKFSGVGKMMFDASGVKIAEKDPYATTSYVEGVRSILYHIHYGDYGGYALKIISFLMGLVTCFVIMSGVMIWLTAREKKNMDEKKRRFNLAVIRVYLAVGLSLYPVTALAFIVVKTTGHSGMSFLYPFFFLTWLAVTVLLLLKKGYAHINKVTLLSGGIMGLFIPIANASVTGNWFWAGIHEGQFSVWFTDVFWLVLSVLALYALWLKQNSRNKKAPQSERSSS